MREYYTKPPLGVSPRWLWMLHRMIDLNNAMGNLLADKSSLLNIDLFDKYLAEMVDLLEEYRYESRERLSKTS